MTQRSDSQDHLAVVSFHIVTGTDEGEAEKALGAIKAFFEVALSIDDVQWEREENPGGFGFNDGHYVVNFRYSPPE